jgi:hypothetical protein
LERQDWTLLSLWIHVPFVIAWIGVVMLDAFAAFAPGIEDGQRARMIAWSRPFVLIAIPVIMVTGIWQTMDNPFFDVESWSALQRLKNRTLYGDLLFWKHVFVVATFGLTILVRFILVPRLRGPTVSSSGGATALAMTDERTLGLVRIASALNLAACLAAVLLATRMVAELH